MGLKFIIMSRAGTQVLSSKLYQHSETIEMLTENNSNFELGRMVKFGNWMKIRNRNQHMIAIEQLENILGIKDDVSSLSRRGEINDALKLLFLSSKVDSEAYSSLLQACCHIRAIREGQFVHTHIIKTGFQIDLKVGNGLLIMYAKCRDLQDAWQVFDEIPDRNVVTWSAMIGGFEQNGLPVDAFKLFAEMLSCGVEPNQFTYGSVLRAIAEIQCLHKGNQVLGHMVKTGYDRHPVGGSALVNMLAKCGALESARTLFDSLIYKSVYAATAMITGYAKSQKMQDACELFWAIPEKNVVSWNALIAGHAQNELNEEAVDLFRQMRFSGHVLNQSTFPPVLSACGNWAALGNGRYIHAVVVKTLLKPGLFVGNALITMYAKCSSMEDVLKMFQRMHSKNVVTWNALISGYGQHGQPEKALAFFEQMEKARTEPNDVTLLCVLSACNHAGLVDQGYHYFNSVCRKCRMVPSDKHLACMVDLLGRSGYLDEAVAFIKNNSTEPCANAWKALLGACKLHGNADLGRYAAEKLLESGQQHASTYVLLQHIYAKAGKLGEAAKARKMLKDAGVRKVPGFSWIEVRNKVHRFVVADDTHPQMKEIYELLKNIHLEMKNAGYVPDINSACCVE